MAFSNCSQTVARVLFVTVVGVSLGVLAARAAQPAPSPATTPSDDLKSLSDSELWDRFEKAYERMKGASAECHRLLDVARKCNDKSHEGKNHPAASCPNKGPKGPGISAGICRHCVDCTEKWKAYWDAVAAFDPIAKDLERIMDEMCRRRHQ